MFAVLRGFGVPVPDPTTVAGAYAVALADLPADLVEAAFTGALANHRYGMRPPLPAELLAAVQDEFHARRSLLAKLELMNRAPVEIVGPRPSPEDRAKVSGLVAGALKVLRA
jgi:hypothetical protein